MRIAPAWVKFETANPLQLLKPNVIGFGEGTIAAICPFL
jgi:hypothetical protein